MTNPMTTLVKAVDWATAKLHIPPAVAAGVRRFAVTLAWMAIAAGAAFATTQLAGAHLSPIYVVLAGAILAAVEKAAREHLAAGGIDVPELTTPATGGPISTADAPTVGDGVDRNPERPPPFRTPGADL